MQNLVLVTIDRINPSIASIFGNRRITKNVRGYLHQGVDTKLVRNTATTNYCFGCQKVIKVEQGKEISLDSSRVKDSYVRLPTTPTTPKSVFSQISNFNASFPINPFHVLATFYCRRREQKVFLVRDGSLEQTKGHAILWRCLSIAHFNFEHFLSKNFSEVTWLHIKSCKLFEAAYFSFANTLKQISNTVNGKILLYSSVDKKCHRGYCSINVKAFLIESA
ncbi:hypothetical protein [Acaryochloris sp. IP29b_bin.148]|uniref:hypothetical protein n=1 Tax=Acaryochloris sp. IP29b_bin.148 TaxID=2969218 RepID=UPI0026308EE4|nr:hypothetical protein [Acaryochloris sp. IP29b_bin.148]